jgi:hypothetical protein
VAESAVRSVIIVVALERRQCGCGVSLVDDQEPVEEFAADRLDEAFGDGVGPRCAHWCAGDRDVDGGVETASKAAVNVASRSWIRN